MDAQAYILSRLKRLTEPSVIAHTPQTTEEMIDCIFKTITSKKFRKVSIPEINKTAIRKAIELNVNQQTPIRFHFPFGAYKLWRLEETPEADWAELFALMYYAAWLKPVCEVYKPGVHFVLWSDEIIVNKLNNIPTQDTEAYAATFLQIIRFLQTYLSPNMHFELFPERSRYPTYAQFERELHIEIEKLRTDRTQNPQPLSDSAKRSIDLNVKLTPKQSADPHWREEVDLIHIAYYILRAKKEHPRRILTTDSIVAFPTLLTRNNAIGVGTTKTSTAKFWVGVGALQQRGDSYIETILSPSQIAHAKTSWESVHIPGLEGKNFSRVRVLK